MTKLSKKEIPLGHYRHYKGGEYDVIGFAHHSESLERLVIYRKCYGDKGTWVRPIVMFGETVVVDGKKMKRFTLLRPKGTKAR